MRLSSTARSQNSGTLPRLWVETSITRPSSRKLTQQRDDGVLGLDVDAGEGLVEQDHPAVLGQRAGQEDALLLAAGELADLALAEVAHADAGQRLSTASRSARVGDAQHVHVAVAAHHHHVLDQNGEVPVDVLALRHIGDEVLLQRLVDR